jgi:hypothetical protein
MDARMRPGGTIQDLSAHDIPESRLYHGLLGICAAIRSHSLAVASIDRQVFR